MTDAATIPPLDPARIAEIRAAGGEITPLEPLGAEVRGIDLRRPEPPHEAARAALEREMAERGFLVFKNEAQIEPDDFLRASCWWGGRRLHSTHGVHPATPGNNHHIFRLSNDKRHGIPGVGPQWHNDGSFNTDTFSHSGYHIIRPAERGGGTYFAHQGAAYDALPDARKELWERLSSVNSASGVVHPLVHEHPVSGRKCIWLHLGMTGAVIEKAADQHGFRLLDAEELTELCRQYNEILNAGLENGYAINFEYQQNDCVFIDNLAVAHRAAPEAHLPAEQQGLRIMHRSTVRGVQDLAPGFGLPLQLDIYGASPLGDGVWRGGGLGFRWEEGIPMQN
ncbi:MAG: TauD/TfdA family dioxygenase [Marivibrio sp.]|uniref:TauD/TfdA dioxygenase family protein n=1 Tax=Marivibrio sp. TaxID=2039719 RepID=UPI0032F05531